MSEERVVYGYLHEPFSWLTENGKVTRGLIKVLFEEINNKIYPINTEEFFDEREEVFLFDGFEALQNKYHERLIKISAIENDKFELDSLSHNQTRYVTFKNRITEETKGKIVALIDDIIPDPLNLDISLTDIPHSRVFYIKNDDFIYGPFSLISNALSDNEGLYQTIKPLSGKLTGFPNLTTGTIYKFNYSEFKEKHSDDLVDRDGVTYLINSSLIKSFSKETIDFMTQEDIVALFSQLKKKRKIPPQTVDLIRNELNSLNLGPSSKKAVLAVVKSAAESNSEWRDHLFEVLENDPSGKKLIDSAVSAQQEKYEKKWKENIIVENEELESKKIKDYIELEEIQESIANENYKLVQVNQEIQEKLEKLENSLGFDEEIKKKRLETDLALENQQKELKNLQEELGLYADLKGVSDRITNLQQDEEYLHRNKITLQDTLSGIKTQITEQDTVLQSRLREMIPYVSSIIQAPLPEKLETFELVDTPVRLQSAEIGPTFASDIVNGICTQFNKEHQREYSAGFIASILVAQQQNFICVFSGAPGIGKTSFMRILAKILTLGERFKEVAVGRSWTSEREFVGFYNSLTEKFIPAPSAIYQYLKAMENDDSKSHSSQIILLDEANLSPIEHYAAMFLNIADDESDKSFCIGKEKLYLPSSLRVICTVNHDMTTEPLSARLVDRAPVIPFDLEDNKSIDVAEIDCDLYYCAETFEEVFGTNSSFAKSSVKSDTIKIIIKQLKEKKTELGMPFIVSVRKQIKIEHYVSTLTPILESSCLLSSKNALIQASDYAVLYFILPSLSGNGLGLKQRLTKVLTMLSDAHFDRSFEKLQDMLDRGEHHLDTFNFFNY
jgi:hypothetical protein